MNTSTNSCRRSLNVERATNDLEGTVSDMRDAMEALESHLVPLLSPERPSDIGEDRQQGESEIAERIISSADRVRSVSARIRDLIERL